MTSRMSIQFTRHSPGGSGHLGWQLFEPVTIPGLFPACQAQQPVQQTRRESPHQKPRYTERGADVPAGMGDLHPVGRIQQRPQRPRASHMFASTTVMPSSSATIPAAPRLSTAEVNVPLT